MRPIVAKKRTIIASAQKTIRLEAEALEQLARSVDRPFEEVIEYILKNASRLVVAGIGKSGNIAQKLVATFVSTGQSATFMHAADAIHGDLGLIQKGDLIVVISKSGESPEIKMLVPLLKSMGNKLVAIVSNRNSYLGKNADWCLLTPVSKEACPNNLAPTTSTTAQLALGDAMAVALMEQRGFSSRDFAKNHPGGALGKKLYITVDDIIGQTEAPAVQANASIQDVIIEISSKRLGATAVLRKNTLVGIVTDGDLRRMLQSKKSFEALSAKDVMNKSPKHVESSELAVAAFQIMEQHKITSLIVLEGKKYKGIIHLHDILREGIFS